MFDNDYFDDLYAGEVRELLRQETKNNTMKIEKPKHSETLKTVPAPAVDVKIEITATEIKPETEVTDFEVTAKVESVTSTADEAPVKRSRKKKATAQD